ncbi:hypothetical protein [Naumannella cuiyingiana]|uniref:Uncharacterized protein n=1 Tax=Naumannella cuiyingiana TaxID=1347891 RepID=A0A7Z0IMA3_9ACTN|nr:hypothetical protein [Naumannella cuiyingiana]NYI72529.1 hypothetical protein [Naumannella cuiyingiana]
MDNTPLGVAIGAVAASLDPDNAGVATVSVVLNTAISPFVIMAVDRAARGASARGVGARH